MSKSPITELTELQAEALSIMLEYGFSEKQARDLIDRLVRAGEQIGLDNPYC